MTRPASKQLLTQYWLLSLFTAQLERDDLAEADVAKLTSGKAKAEERILALGGTPSAVAP